MADYAISITNPCIYARDFVITNECYVTIAYDRIPPRMTSRLHVYKDDLPLSPANIHILSGIDAIMWCEEVTSKVNWMVHRASRHVFLTHAETHPELWGDDDDEYSNSVDVFALSEGFCNGPKCKNCGVSKCHHCVPGFEEETCPSG